MKQGASNRKVNEQAREVIASILLFDISDPKLKSVTITGCEVSYDRSVCNVFYTTDPGRYGSVAKAFERARGAIRSLMAGKLSWRVAPELRFLRDESVDTAERIALALERDRGRNEESAAIAAAAEAEAAAEQDAAAEQNAAVAEAEAAAEQDAAAAEAAAEDRPE